MHGQTDKNTVKSNVEAGKFEASEYMAALYYIPQFLLSLYSVPNFGF